jgi:hypothetical protein
LNETGFKNILGFKEWDKRNPVNDDDLQITNTTKYDKSDSDGHDSYDRYELYYIEADTNTIKFLYSSRDKSKLLKFKRKIEKDVIYQNGEFEIQIKKN